MAGNLPLPNVRETELNGSNSNLRNGNNNMITSNVLPETGFVRLPTILQMFPVGKSSWWLGVKSGKYPQPVKLGPRTTAWRVQDVRALIEAIK
jgi:predicted DNA-binding transcriptional regulator AlpA